MPAEPHASATLDWTDQLCPVARTVDLIGEKWSLLIIRDAMDGARSFTEFQQRTGIARNILADRLRRLTERGILTQRTAPSGRRRQYILTPAGRDLLTTISALRQWGERHAFNKGERHSTLLDDAGNRVPSLALFSRDGRALDVESVRVVRDE